MCLVIVVGGVLVGVVGVDDAINADFMLVLNKHKRRHHPLTLYS